MLNDIEMARLTNTLQVPLAVQDILDGNDTLSEDMRFGLHEVLSDYQPDSALLCIALSARKIAAGFARDYSNMGVLKIECERMIAEYAEIWVDHAKSKPIDDNVIFDTLVQIPEDLECLGELLEICAVFLRHKNEDVAGLCDILATQARAQVLIADTFIDLMEQDDTNTVQADMGIGAQNTLPHVNAPEAFTPVYTDNVIQFPGVA